MSWCSKLFGSRNKSNNAPAEGRDADTPIFITEKVYERAYPPCDKRADVDEIVMNLRRHYAEMRERLATISELAGKMQDRARLAAPCREQRCRLLACYRAQHHQPLECAQTLREFQLCAKNYALRHVERLCAVGSDNTE